VIKSEHVFSGSGRENRVEPMEGALVHPMSVALSKQRARWAWCGAALAHGEGSWAGCWLEPAPPARCTTEDARGFATSGEASSAQRRRRSAAARGS